MTGDRTPRARPTVPQVLLIGVAVALGTFLLSWYLTLLGFNNIYFANLAALVVGVVVVIGLLLLFARSFRSAAASLGTVGFIAGLVYFLPLSEVLSERDLLDLQRHYCEMLIPTLTEYRIENGEFPRHLDLEPFNQRETPFFLSDGAVQYLSDGEEFSFLIQRSHPDIAREVYWSGDPTWVVGGDHPESLRSRAEIYSVPARVRCQSWDAEGREIWSWCPETMKRGPF